jgi:hypothetical protein
MATKLHRLIALCRKIQSVSDEALHELDRASLLVVRQELQDLKQDIDKILGRLTFIDEQQLH